MEDNKLIQEMKRRAVIVATHANHSALEISPNRLFTKIVESQKDLVTMWKVLPSAENINLVQTQLEHYSLWSKARTLLMKPLQSL